MKSAPPFGLRGFQKRRAREDRRWKAYHQAAPRQVQLGTREMSDSDRRDFMKDQHLLEAAFAADRIIVTLDENLRRILASMPRDQETRESNTWVNPKTGGDALLRQIEATRAQK